MNPNPPRWVCQDPCLSENDDGLLCGKTDHFTNFALLLQGNGRGGSSACDSTIDEWLTGVWYGDLILILLCVLVMVGIGIFIISISYWTPAKRIFYGEEGSRILHLRSMSSSSTPAIE